MLPLIIVGWLIFTLKAPWWVIFLWAIWVAFYLLGALAKLGQFLIEKNKPDPLFKDLQNLRKQMQNTREIINKSRETN